MITPPSASLVSVVIPTRNYGHYVGQAIRSALHQGYRPLQVIVVDDGSSDDTPAVLQKFAGAVEVLRLDGAGVSAARNAGLDRARGDYVVFLDADDVLLPGGVAAQVARLDGRPDVTAVVGEWYTYQVPAHAAFRSCSHLAGEDALSDLVRRNIVATPSAMMVRRAALSAAGGFDTSLSFTADWDMWLRLARRGSRFASVTVPVTTYRVHGRSMTADVDRAIRDVSRLLDRCFGDPDMPGPVRGLEPRARFETLMYLAHLSLQQGALRQAEDCLRGALRWNPGAIDALPFYRTIVEAASGSPAPAGRDAGEAIRAVLAILIRVDDADGEDPARRRALRHLAVGMIARIAADRGRQREHLRAAVRASWRAALTPPHLGWTVRLVIPGGMMTALRRNLATIGVRRPRRTPAAVEALLGSGGTDA